MIRAYLNIIILCAFIVGGLHAKKPFSDKAPPSLADHLHLKPDHVSIDSGWLANMTGLPTEKETKRLSKYVTRMMLDETDKQCAKIDWKLRHMLFLHFVLYQKMANRQSIYLNREITRHWAHVFGMLLKESSGDTTNITAMTGRSMSTYRPKTNLERWRRISTLTRRGRIPLNTETNFGLTQLSSDRLFVAFDLTTEREANIAFLEGREGADSPRQVDLDTAIAIRRLIWFYQDIAQGRVKQDDMRIPRADINKPELAERFQKGIEMALMYCGTYYMFEEGHHTNEAGREALRNAVESIAYCRLGNSKVGYAQSIPQHKCFAQWVTLCPALNFDIAMLTPMAYFATRHEEPICEDTLNRLLVKKPKPKKIKKPKAHHPEKQAEHTEKPEDKRMVVHHLRKVIHSVRDFLSNMLLKPSSLQ